ncbi:MAG: hypothetical protein GC202_10765 [Alphaproteobacteria bacterium]|nr:hypothetical protein [Alphaproteobacteria bacterium]
MASEYRVIFFENIDLVAAAFDWKRTQGEPPPNGRATKLTIDRDRLSFKIEVKKKDGDSATFIMEDAQMTAALIMLCRKRKIPLPMKSKKNLVNVGGQIAFMISMPSEGIVASVPIEYITGTVAEIKKSEVPPAAGARPQA